VQNKADLFGSASRALSVVALAATALFGCEAGQPGQPAATGGVAAPAGGMKAGVHAQDFTTRDMNGNTVRLSTYLGKGTILLNFWSTYCEPCLAEFPHLRKMQDDKKAQGLIVLAVSMDGPETVAQVKPFAQRNNLNFPVLLDEDSAICALYNPKKSGPLTILIDKTGNVAQVREGYNPGDEDVLAVEVDKLLAK
jgi:peroxiredoxin